MRIHLGLYYLNPLLWNGHAQMMRFLAEGLRQGGHGITATHRSLTPAGTCHHFSQLDDDGNWRNTSTYDDSAARTEVTTGPWNEGLVTWAAGLLKSHSVDVVYAQGAEDILDVVRAGKSIGARCVYHVHDYDLLCGRRFLLDHNGRRCSGPETVQKCDACLRHRYAWHARAASRLAAIPGLLEALPATLRPLLQRYAYIEAVERIAARGTSAIEMVDCFISTGALVTQTLVQAGVPAGKIRVLPHVITRPEMREPPPDAPRRPGPLRIGYFGRLNPEKGVDVLATALDSIRRTGEFAFEWWVICNGDAQTAATLQRISGVQPDSFRHIQSAQGIELRDAIRQLDLAVFPSVWAEIGPLAMLETLRQGVFCVASDSLGMLDTVSPGTSGYVFSAGDPNALARAIRDAARHPYVLGEQPRRPLLEAPDDRRYFASLFDLLAVPSPLTAPASA